MNKIYLLLLIILPFSENYSQDSFIEFKSDFSLTHLGPAGTKFYYITKDAFLFSNIDDVISFCDSSQSIQPSGLNGIDFNNKTLLLLSYHGVDCHSRFRFSTITDSLNKSFTVNTDVIYGGCRAGGNFYASWFLMPKLPGDYKINFTSKMIDERKY